MDAADWLTHARLPLVLALAFAVAANDAVTGMASAVGGRLLSARIAALLAAVATAVPVLLLAGPTAADSLARILPEAASLPVAPAEAAAAAAATTLVVLLATAFGRVVPSLLVFAVALAAPRLTAGEDAAALLPLLPIAVAAAAMPAVAAALAALAVRRAVQPTLADARPRDRLNRVAPALAAVGAAVAVWLVVEGVAVAYAGAALPAWLPPGLGLVAGLAAFAAVAPRLARRPFWVANRPDGVEAAHARPALAGSLVLAFAGGGQQALLATALLTAALPAASAVPADGGPAPALLAAVAAAFGLALLGHRPAARHGRAVAGSPAGGAAANLGAGAVLAAGGAAGLPLLGGPAAAGALAGAALAGGRPSGLAGLLAVWLLAVAAGAGLALAILAGLAAA
jgi:phosphate/sulfate permease